MAKFGPVSSRYLVDVVLASFLRHSCSLLFIARTLALMLEPLHRAFRLWKLATLP